MKQKIPQQKLKAFTIGTMGKRSLSKRELEEQRKKEEEKAAAHVSKSTYDVDFLVFKFITCKAS